VDRVAVIAMALAMLAIVWGRIEVFGTGDIEDALSGKILRRRSAAQRSTRSPSAQPLGGRFHPVARPIHSLRMHPCVASRRRHWKDHAHTSSIVLLLANRPRGRQAPPAQARRARPMSSSIPTPQESWRTCQLADVKKGDVLYDLGSGDGRIPITAARLYGIRAVGIDIDPQASPKRRKRRRRRA
jgi:hypothetical protein